VNVINLDSHTDDVKADPFDPAALRVDQTFAGAGVKKLLVTVPVRKPNRQDFVRTHPGEDYRLTTAIVELKEEREFYVIAPHIVSAITGEYVVANLFTTINRQGVLSLWPVRLPGPDGKTNAWHESAATAAAMAMTTWTRVTANMALGAYEAEQHEIHIWPGCVAAEFNPAAAGVRFGLCGLGATGVWDCGCSVGRPAHARGLSIRRPYLAFAKQAGAAPPEATKATHRAVREMFKACVLAVQYGMGAESLALRIGQPTIRARELLRLHRETYRVFWAWSDAAVDHAMLHGHLDTVFGWRVHVPPDPNDRSLRRATARRSSSQAPKTRCVRAALPPF
jgi:hypothetical protein